MSQDNSDTAEEQSESANLRANWERTAHHNLRDPAVQQQIETNGRAVIASWAHKEADADVVYTYQPGAEDPYLVTLDYLEISERFSSRSAGGSFNKELMRSATIADELAIQTCGAETADGDPCQVQVEEADERCHLHQDDGEQEEEQEA
jgi:hypothetical protein